MTIAAWVLAVVLIAVGLAGTILPALPGIPLIFAGILVAAWIDDFTRISGWTVGILAIVTIVAVAIDYLAALLSARHAGASKQGVIGAAVGTVAGIFSGLWGLLFMPLVGAAIGEYIAQKDALRAGKIGVATWLGLLIGTALKISIAFAMVGVFLVALFF